MLMHQGRPCNGTASVHRCWLPGTATDLSKLFTNMPPCAVAFNTVHRLGHLIWGANNDVNVNSVRGGALAYIWLACVCMAVAVALDIHAMHASDPNYV